jgi:protein-L-isoaspartate(D-aspartate) O-methyltransferase
LAAFAAHGKKGERDFTTAIPMNTTDMNKRKRLATHLKAMGIQDERVLEAIQKVPREEFVPKEIRAQAWDDTALPIGLGQTISQPLIVATMTEALEIKAGDTVLEIGTGCGYQAAILAQLARRVYTIERHKPLAEQSEKRFHDLKIRNISSIYGDGMKGWPTMNGFNPAPFDKIIVTAAAREKPPSALLDQLKVGGLMVVPVGGPGNQVLKRYKKEADDTYSMRTLMDVRFVPLLPDVEGAKKNGKDKVPAG